MVIRSFDGTYDYSFYDYDLNEEDREFEDGCADLLEKIQDLRKWNDLGTVDSAVLEIIEDLINLL